MSGIRITATRTGEDEVVVRFMRSENCMTGGPELYAMGEGQQFTLALYRAFVNALATGVLAKGGMTMSIDEREFGLYKHDERAL